MDAFASWIYRFKGLRLAIVVTTVSTISVARAEGVDFSLGYKVEAVANVNGGLERKTGWLGNLDLKANFDLEQIIGLPGTKAWIYGLGNHGSKPSTFVGDALGTSNIEAPSTFKIYEVVLTQTVGSFSGSVGLIDLNSKFFVTDSAGIFRQSAFGISPTLAQTGANGPSIFPSTALAFVAEQSIGTVFYARAGVFNAVAGDPERPYGTHVSWAAPDGFLMIAEGGYDAGEEGRPEKLGFGVWGYGDRVASLDATRSDAVNWGAYALGERSLNDTFELFLRLAYAAPRVNTFAASLETGVVARDLIGGRPDDRLAVGLAWAASSQAARDQAALESNETVIELTYRCQVSDRISIAPDLQYVINPGLAPEVSNAWVTALRGEFEL